MTQVCLGLSKSKKKAKKKKTPVWGFSFSLRFDFIFDFFILITETKKDERNMLTYDKILFLLEKNEPLTLEEERLVFACYNKNRDKELKQKIVLKNIGLIHGIAKNYNKYGVDYDDLYQEGVLGLCKAVDMFDYERGFKFSTYACHWIRSYIGHYVSSFSRTIRLPSNMHEELYAISKIRQRYITEGLDAPSFEEIARESGLTVERIKEVLRTEKYTKTVSLNTISYTDNEKADFSQVVEDEKTSNVFDKIIDDADLENFWPTVQEILTEREFEVLGYRMGYLSDEPLTLDAIGQMYGYTREWVRQIESQAIKKLRNPKNMIALRIYRQ